MKVTGSGLSAVSCSGTARMVTSTTTTDVSNKLDITCYPIPVRNQLRIDFNREVKETVHIALMDAAGKTIRIEKANGLYHNLDMAGLQSGVYLIKVTGANVNITKLVTKQ